MSLTNLLISFGAVMSFKSINFNDIPDTLFKAAFDLWLTGSAVPSPDEVYQSDYDLFNLRWNMAVNHGHEEEIKAAVLARDAGAIWILILK
jgi:hypothetical protein